MQKKTVEEMNLLDDFLFGKIVSYPGIGQEFCQRILSIILDRRVENVQVIPQRVYYGADPETRGTRLDVFIEEDGKAKAEVANVYDIEPDRNNRKNLVQALPKRVRFYHAKMDSASLKAGESYRNLKNVCVIMITPYDPFGFDRMVYTICNSCKEMPEMPYEDGALTLFLYTKGKRGEASEKLQKLLRYMEDSREENAQDEELRDIYAMVKTVKQDEEVKLEYMKIFEQEELIRQDAMEEGMKEGMREGEERLINLMICLMKEKRSINPEDLKRDKDLREKLYKEYNL